MSSCLIYRKNKQTTPKAKNKIKNNKKTQKPKTATTKKTPFLLIVYGFTFFLSVEKSYCQATKT